MKKQLLTILLLACTGLQLSAQKFLKQVKNDEADLIMAGDYLSPFVPYLLTSYYRSYNAHAELWGYRPEKSYILLNDFQDDGNAGASVSPYNFISICVAAPSLHYNIMPNTERFQQLFNHEHTHVAMCDKTSSGDDFWRKVFRGKVTTNERYPMSAVYSYLTAPRWYSPRWYQEGIAIFMETWLNGGVGRSLGNYDEMFFRTLIRDEQKLYTVTGLETEGTAIDFQVGANSYLYGARFVNYLAYKYGVDKLMEFYNRKPGTRAVFLNQFKKIYGSSLSSVWKEWIDYETTFQRNNLDSIAAYPLTEITPLAHNMGSASNVIYNNATDEFVVGVNHPGAVAYVCGVNKQTGKVRKIVKVDGPTLYKVCHIALDSVGNRLFVTTQNNDIRGVGIYDFNTGKKLKYKQFARLSSMVYNHRNNRLYGIMNHEGKTTLVYYTADIETMIPLYTFHFGEVISDLALSHDNGTLMACLNSLDGEQSLIEFDLAALDDGNLAYSTLFKDEGTTLNSFSYSLNDSCVIGTSYYTGAGNLWQIDRATKEFDLLTNVETGLFSPIEYASDSLFAMSFTHDGLQPVTLQRKVIHDANPVVFLGQEAYENNPVLETWTRMVRKHVADSDSLKFNTEVTSYSAWKRLRLANAYPDIAGFKNTIVAGYRMNFSDPLGYHRLNLFLGMSPWSNYKAWKRIHFSLDWSYGFWSINAALNKSDFYDLFGPRKVGRAGYSVGLTYDRRYTLRAPFEWGWSANVTQYGLLDAMPLYQNVAVTVDNMQGAQFNLYAKKTRSSVGAIQAESGYNFTTTVSGSLVDGKLFPQIDVTYDRGFLLPFTRNLSFWLRGAAGKTFGDKNSVFGYSYFGGFRNNYIDFRNTYSYRNAAAMPGIGIDAIDARHYGKLTAEVLLPPIRFGNVGLPNLYPKHLQINLFSTGLATNPFESSSKNYINVGAQCSMTVVMFTYLKTTWSVGYANMVKGIKKDGGQWMLSLKLLGN